MGRLEREGRRGEHSSIVLFEKRLFDDVEWHGLFRRRMLFISSKIILPLLQSFRWRFVVLLLRRLRWIRISNLLPPRLEK